MDRPAVAVTTTAATTICGGLTNRQKPIEVMLSNNADIKQIQYSSRRAWLHNSS